MLIKGAQRQKHIRNNWQNAQIGLCTQKRSLPGAHWWTYLVLELTTSSRGIFPFHQGKAYVGSQRLAGEKQGEPPKQMFWAAVRNVPAKSPPGASEPRAAVSLQPSQRVIKEETLLRKTHPREPDIARSQPHVGSQNPFAKVGPGGHCSRGKVGGKESLIYFGGQQLGAGGRGRFLSKGQLPPLITSGQELL